MPNVKYASDNDENVNVNDYESYNTPFTVDESLDDLLGRILNTDFATYGFIKIESYPDAPIIVDTITKPGNYMIENWGGGPIALQSFSPVNLIVYKTDNKLIQIIPYMLDLYSRTVDIDENGNLTGEYTAWACSAMENLELYVGMTEPVVNKPSLWINTTIKGFPVVYLYNPVSGWSSVGSMIDTLSSLIYDTTGKRTDIFRYFELKYGIPVDGEARPEDEVTFYNLRSKFLQHKEILGHMTLEERDMFERMLSVPEVQEYVDLCKKELIEYVDERIKMMHHDILHEVLNADVTMFHDHFTDPNHSSAEKKQYWNDKSEEDHAHEFDDRVVVSAQDIVDGVLSLDIMPPGAVHTLKNVLTHEERFKLTKDQVQNGDSVSVLEETDTYNSGLYLVYDDTKLDSDEGYIYYRTRRFANVEYVDIIRRPTTLEGYGITDGSRIVETINDNGMMEFVYPYMTEDNSINYAITKAIIDYGDHISDILDAIEEAMKPEDIDGIWKLAKRNYAEYQEIDKRWKPYLNAHDTYNEIMTIFNNTEDIYTKAYDISY